MLDPSRLWDREVRPFLSQDVRAQIAAEPWQVEAYFGLRAQIFAEEQGLFSGSDRDPLDSCASPIVALSHAFGMPDEVVGVVRIYEAEGGAWYGGRLGVCPRYRRRGAVGSALITCAVSSAHAFGATRFFAQVQVQNVRYFERHAFRALRPLELLGRAHWLMEADLSVYPASLSPVTSKAA
ncbi:MAG TPA: MSMEG_0567/Sll0786 family nitrogen starvation N-acetyltransferase [Polyangiaceae bacterium]|nr:MSMEG_0567/Sll0786 family nitrogen starvation N-acetyltransferase [Polyangiaceae bacterium]